MSPRSSFTDYRLPRLCVVGPMVGRNPGLVTTQGERLSDLFAISGYPTMSVSSSRYRVLRLAEILDTIVRRRAEIDVVILQVYSGMSFVVEDAASALCQLFGIPIIMVLRGGALPQFAARFSSWSRRVLQRAAIIVTPTRYLERFVHGLNMQCEVIPNIIEIEKYPFRVREKVLPRLFWFRSFHSMYNPRMVPEVLYRLRQRVPNATLVMAGQDKGGRAEIQALAARLGLADAVEFPGFLDMDGKTYYGAMTDILINTSDVDNMPVALVEACAMGLPIVTTDAGGIPELLSDGDTGLIVKRGDVEAMVAAIEALLRDADLAKRLSINGRKLAETCSWQAVRARWESVIEAAIPMRARYQPSATSRQGNSLSQ